MTDQETQDILQLYAEHEDAAWWPKYADMRQCPYEWPHLALRKEAVFSWHRLTDKTAVILLLGSLLEWLAEMGVHVYRDHSISDGRGSEYWAAVRRESANYCEFVLELSIHHAALAAYKHIKEASHD